MTRNFDLIVIGSGAAAGSAWSYARSLGKSVLIFEKDTLGGECPTFACMPTKALLQSAQTYQAALRAEIFGIEAGSVRFDYSALKARKDFVISRTGAAQGDDLYREAGVEVIHQEVRFVSPDVVEAAGETYRAERFLVATGSVPRIPDIPGLRESGFLTSREAIDLTERPDSVLILGGGPVGCEFAQLFNDLGIGVFLVDHNLRLLKHEDQEVGTLLAHLFEHRSVRVLLKTNVAGVTPDGAKKTVTYETAGATSRLSVDKILIATGKAPCLDLGLDKAGIAYGERGIQADAHLMTTNPRVFAAGDCIGPYLFTHAASYQGRLAAHNAFQAEKIHVNYAGMPRCVFTSPEIATAGLTEAEARQQCIPYLVGLAPVGGLGRANTAEEFDGFVKVLARRDGILIGAAIVAPRAGEMVHELVLAIRAGLPASLVADTIHAFPTYSEAVAEACSQIAAS